MVKDKLPKETLSLQKYLDDLNKVVSEPALGQSDLNELNEVVSSVCVASFFNI